MDTFFPIEHPVGSIEASTILIEEQRGVYSCFTDVHRFAPGTLDGGACHQEITFLMLVCGHQIKPTGMKPQSRCIDAAAVVASCQIQLFWSGQDGCAIHPLYQVTTLIHGDAWIILERGDCNVEVTVCVTDGWVWIETFENGILNHCLSLTVKDVLAWSARKSSLKGPLVRVKGQKRS